MRKIVSPVRLLEISRLKSSRSRIFATRLNLAALALSLQISLPVSLAAQERPDPVSSGSGGRAAAMSQAVTASVSDAFAIGWNPAGLASMTRAEVAFAGTVGIFMSAAQGTTNIVTSTGYPRYSASSEFAGASDPIQFVGAAVPFKFAGRTVTAGVAWRHFAEGPRQGSYKQRRAVNNGRYFSTATYTIEGGVRAISPSLAVALTERLQLGVTANILSGSSVYSTKDSLSFRSRISENDYAGLALEIGGMFQLSEGLRIGANVTLPHDRTMTIDNDTTERAATRAAPLQVAVGVAKKLNAKSSLNLDARFAPWSSVEFTDDVTGNVIPSRVGVNDAMGLHLGWERDVSGEDRLGVMHRGLFRLGAYVRQTTSQDLNGDGILSFGGSLGKTWLMTNSAFEMGLQVGRSTRWVRSDTPATTVSLANNDFVLTAGVRKQF